MVKSTINTRTYNTSIRIVVPGVSKQKSCPAEFYRVLFTFIMLVQQQAQQQ